ncbi:MAG TPA: hypothetical protein VGL59_04090 [Polyangia bacterium]
MSDQISFRTVFAPAYVAAEHSVHVALAAGDPLAVARAAAAHHRVQLRYLGELTDAARATTDSDVVAAIQAEIISVYKESSDLRKALGESGERNGLRP